MELITSVVPLGLNNRMRPRLPSDKSLGYYQISLREKDLAHLIHHKDVPKPEGEAPAKREVEVLKLLLASRNFFSFLI